MDYEKAYKDALERARAGKPMNEVFPELHESEDERIRKEIIDYLSNEQHNVKQLTPRTNEFEDWIAYLEKLKEQKQKIKVRIPKFRVGDIIQRVPLERWDSSKKITSIDEHGYNYNLSHLGDTVSGGAIGFAFENEYELVEQKPTEKQDYSGLTKLERAIHRGFLCAGVENVPVEIVKETAQEGRLVQMKSAEWSAEDERMLSRCIKSIECSKMFAETKTFKEAKDKEIDWLKSIRPQSHWKPSEEQMQSFEYFIKLWGNSNGQLEYIKVFNDVKTLYNDLKKML